MSFLRTPTARRLFCCLWYLTWLVIAVLLLRPLPFGLPGGSDILGHFLLFGFMGLAIVSFAGQARHFVAPLAVTVTLGIALEYGQSFVPQRYFDNLDLLANVVGALAGGLLGLWLFRMWRTPDLPGVAMR